jgi:putative flippase GtrA
MNRAVSEQPDPGIPDPVPSFRWRALQRDLPRYPKFLMVGLTGVVVNLATFVLTVDAIVHSPTSNFFGDIVHFASKTAPNPVVYFVASAVAFGVATLWNFALNSWWTFRTPQAHRHSAARRLGLYYGVSLGSFGVNEVVLLATQAFLPPLFGQGLGVVAGSVVGYLGNSRYTFAELSPA